MTTFNNAILNITSAFGAALLVGLLALTTVAPIVQSFGGAA
jgi:hypothetical protein